MLGIAIVVMTCSSEIFLKLKSLWLTKSPEAKYQALEIVQD